MLLISIALLDGIYVYLSDELSVRGVDLSNLQEEVTMMKLENNYLYLELLHKQALTTIAAEAAKEGFVPETVIYLQ